MQRQIFPWFFSRWFIIITGLFSATAALATGPAETAAKGHAEPVFQVDGESYEVQQGDTLGSIALAQGIPIDELLEANGLDDPDRVFAGQKLQIPGDPKNGRLTRRGVLLRVPKGFSLARIAAAYKIPIRRIVKANQLASADRVRENQQLLIPGAKHVVKLILPPPCFKKPVLLLRVRDGASEEVPLCFCNGEPNPKAITVLSALAVAPGKTAPFPLHPRLFPLLQKVADRFPGKRFEIVSGPRAAKEPGQESYHNKGQALDFRVADVPNRLLVDFARKFDNVGVGFYPNSVFIHLDTREQSGYWIDYSKPGERAIYGRAGMSAQEIQAIREQRRKPLRQRILEKAAAKLSALFKSVQTAALGEGHADSSADEAAGVGIVAQQ